MAEGKKYVVYGMRAKCSEGSMENYISTDTGHGVLYQGQPVLNANDHVEGVNLTHFGDCKSKLIFEEAKKQADEKYKTEEGDGFFKKLGKGIAKFATKASLVLKETLGSNKCQLETPLPWIFTSRDHMIDGAPALTLDSCCACKFGGVITIVPQEEEATAEDGETEEATEEQPVNDMAAQLFNAAKGLGLGIMSIGKEGIALALENMEAGVKSRIHQLLNFGDKERGVLQMGLSLVPIAAVNSKSKLFQNKDLKEMDAVITKYENEIYEKYKDEIDYYKGQRDKYGKNAIPQEVMQKITDSFKDTDIMKYMETMGDELNSTEAVNGHKNDIVNFFNMVYTGNPIDLKTREFIYPGTNTGANLSIWAAPWPKTNGDAFEKDYAGNWLYGYVGDEYFATPADDGVLKYGAGAAQLISDMLGIAGKDGGSIEDAKDVGAKYLQSIMTGNFGDNVNVDAQSDAEMIQEGIDAHHAKKGK